ncbi:MAG: flagellar basal body L-ring protein FlgH [Planctomycetales bacterium]|nr:flagellar basal body L-ring protein FlgH [Planctomycetales bacterium]
MRFPLVILTLVAAAILPNFANAQYKSRGASLWQRRNPQHVYYFRDTSARSVGDLLTILIQESTDVGNRDQRGMAKATDANFAFDTAAASSGGGSASANFDIGANSDRSYDGSASYSVERDFTARMTVRVVALTTSGDLVIAGTRKQMVGGEMRTLSITGIVRAMDIGPGNTVRSQYVADLKMCYDGDGPESHFTNQNWGGRIFNKIWPF